MGKQWRQAGHQKSVGNAFQLSGIEWVVRITGVESVWMKQYPSWCSIPQYSLKSHTHTHTRWSTACACCYRAGLLPRSRPIASFWFLTCAWRPANSAKLCRRSIMAKCDYQIIWRQTVDPRPDDVMSSVAPVTATSNTALWAPTSVNSKCWRRRHWQQQTAWKTSAYAEFLNRCSLPFLPLLTSPITLSPPAYSFLPFSPCLRLWSVVTCKIKHLQNIRKNVLELPEVDGSKTTFFAKVIFYV